MGKKHEKAMYRKRVKMANNYIKMFICLANDEGIANPNYIIHTTLQTQ